MSGTSPTLTTVHSDLLYILEIHLRFSSTYPASKKETENMKPVNHVAESVPSNLRNASRACDLHWKHRRTLLMSRGPLEPQAETGFIISNNNSNADGCWNDVVRSGEPASSEERGSPPSNCDNRASAQPASKMLQHQGQCSAPSGSVGEASPTTEQLCGRYQPLLLPSPRPAMEILPLHLAFFGLLSQEKIRVC